VGCCLAGGEALGLVPALQNKQTKKIIITSCVRQLYPVLDRFILAHGFRGFSPWLVGSVGFRSVARLSVWQGDCYVRERERKGVGQGQKTLQGSDLLPPTRPHLPKSPPPLNSTTSWRSNLLRGTFQIQTLTHIENENQNYQRNVCVSPQMHMLKSSSPEGWHEEVGPW
jgi:hypothetical protein